MRKASEMFDLCRLPLLCVFLLTASTAATTATVKGTPSTAHDSIHSSIGEGSSLPAFSLLSFKDAAEDSTSRQLDIDLTQSSLFCFAGVPERHTELPTESHQAWCPYNNGICCKFSRHCCPGGHVCVESVQSISATCVSKKPAIGSSTSSQPGVSKGKGELKCVFSRVLLSFVCERGGGQWSRAGGGRQRERVRGMGMFEGNVRRGVVFRPPSSLPTSLFFHCPFSFLSPIRRQHHPLQSEPHHQHTACCKGRL